MKRIIFVTGRPGIGKTTVVLNAVSGLKNKGCTVGGMLSGEVREKGTRVGFEIRDLATGQKGWLAHVGQPTGPQVSKYKVNLNDLDQIGVRAIQNAIRETDIVIVDEIGPMELHSPTFKQVTKDLVTSGKFVLGVVHHNARDPMIESIRAREDVEIFEVTTENRESLHNLLIQKAIQFLRR